ncbi:hypothetical protein [Corynebacterium auris]|uniref:hypothetical protein n=1 Tax=Corynebacterium auris TaxID=44750 RepID=UPI0025B3F3F8|nr:hypothetical protein [Corynebacterium auris]WJY68977.1 hypothetical protein CAURIS_10530 [Corynebacterium auris]
MNNTGNSSGRNYAAAVALIVVAALSFAFLPGATAVFIGVAAAVAGAVFLVMGIQAANGRHPDPLEHDLYGPPETTGYLAREIDWDGDFRREFGGGDTGGAPEARR